MSQPLLHDIQQIVAYLQTIRGFGFAKAAIESQSDCADRLSQRAAAAHHIPTPSYALRSGVCAGPHFSAALRCRQACADRRGADRKTGSSAFSSAAQALDLGGITTLYEGNFTCAAFSFSLFSPSAPSRAAWKRRATARLRVPVPAHSSPTRRIRTSSQAPRSARWPVAPAATPVSAGAATTERAAAPGGTATAIGCHRGCMPRWHLCFQRSEGEARGAAARVRGKGLTCSRRS